MSKPCPRGHEKLAGVLLAGSIVLFLGHIGTLFGGWMKATILLVLLYGVLLFLATVPVYLVFRTRDHVLSLFSALAFAAHGICVILTCDLILADLVLAERFAAAPNTDADAAGLVSTALEIAMDHIRTSTFFVLGLGVTPLGLLIARSGVVARPIGWLGVITGHLALVGIGAHLFGFLPGGSLMMISLVLAMFVFLLVLGVRLVVCGTSPGIPVLGAPGSRS